MHSLKKKEETNKTIKLFVIVLYFINNIVGSVTIPRKCTRVNFSGEAKIFLNYSFFVPVL